MVLQLLHATGRVAQARALVQLKTIPRAKFLSLTLFGTALVDGLAIAGLTRALRRPWSAAGPCGRPRHKAASHLTHDVPRLRKRGALRALSPLSIGCPGPHLIFDQVR